MESARSQRRPRGSEPFDVILFFLVLVAGVARSSEAQAAGRITKGPWVQRVTKDSAIVRVEVDPPAPVTVEWSSPDADGGQRMAESAEVRSLHAVTLSGLAPATRYSYAVRTGTASKPATFVTAPRDDGDAPFRFLAYGDNRSDEAAHAAVVRAMAKAPSDFLVHTGDFVEDGSNPVQWQTFFDIEAPLLGARCLFSAVGNHELTDGAGIEYARFFGPTDLPSNVDKGRGKNAPAATRPEHFDGTFRWGNARFFFINGMVSYRGTVDRSWLENALTAADQEENLKWRVVVVHHGPWSSGPHGGNARFQDAGIVPLLTAHKVDLVLAGHDHIYERGFAEGLAYVVTGGGGAPLYKIKKPSPTAKKLESVRHFVDVSVNATSLQLAPTRLDGSVIERCALVKNTSGWDCDVAPTPSSSPGNDAQTPSSRCSCDVVGRAPAVRGGEIAVTALAASVLRRRVRRRSHHGLHRHGRQATESTERRA
ncbi:MAG TPA: metallophosphoesterase [Labilithrix sp.]|nr:metallophosphoesterase [Labilithrix sp.]